MRNPAFRPADRGVLLFGAVLSFVLASVFLSGWPAGLKPNLEYPFIYGGDGLFQFWMGQRVLEGWLFQNDRSGFPFGSSFLDFPASDAGNLLLLKLLGLASGSYFAAVNLYILLGFSAAFGTAFFALRKIDIAPGAAFAGALLFAFMPYHFARLQMGHLFYTWYFVVPLYCYAGFRVFDAGLHGIERSSWAGFSVLLPTASCFGVYFAFFGVIVILTCGIAGSVQAKSTRAFLIALTLCGSIGAGVLANVAPHLIEIQKSGRNVEVARRVPMETEVYSLKPVHLLLPYEQHRIKALRDFTQRYNTTFPLTNTVSSLGIIGVLGFLWMTVALFRAAAGQQIDQRLRIFTLLTFLLLLIATVGGLNVLFATLVSPLIRGWDRISIFIAFFAIGAFFLLADRARRTARLGRWAMAIVLLIITTIGLYDQTAKPSYNLALSSKARFFQDRQFIASIESALPKGAAVYQLPYLSFPESANLFNLGGYDLLVGFLNSRDLRWSSGGTRGREADLFYRELSKKPLGEQLECVRALGFSGVYIDRNGYADNGASVVDEMTRRLGRAPTLTRNDGRVVFFVLD
ncbi:sugar translocase [Variovorax soli]|uniref:Phosphoglycerol transferase n=1 Tax=Variovorax soli TaxID=376815 RepID=A0ABU1NBY0_9BURK|nr:sugar translocase [Variovorax soli]MDR6535958.1 phosphoglycerol transferase [Variovorax soli]